MTREEFIQKWGALKFGTSGDRDQRFARDLDALLAAERRKALEEAAKIAMEVSCPEEQMCGYQIASLIRGLQQS